MNITKSSILALLLIFTLVGCNSQAHRPLPPKNKLIVLCYHNIGDNNSNYTTTAGKLINQVSTVLAEGYQPIGLEQLSGFLYNGEEIPVKSFLLTFDDAMISDYEYVFPFLVKNNLKAIFFVPTSLIGDGNHLNEKQIREMSDNNCCDFGSHSVSHKNLYTLSDEVLDKELGSSQKILEQITGKEIISFSYPNGFFADRDIAALKKYAYKLAFTVLPGLNDAAISPFAIRRITVSNLESDENFKAMVEGNITYYQQYYAEMLSKSTKNKMHAIARFCAEELRRYKDKRTENQNPGRKQ